MHIVAVQLEIAWENKQHNRQRVEQLLDQASVEPDSLIVLPEMFETGFSMNLSATAQTEQRESEQFVRDVGAAASFGCTGWSGQSCEQSAAGGSECKTRKLKRPATKRWS